MKELHILSLVFVQFLVGDEHPSNGIGSYTKVGYLESVPFIDFHWTDVLFSEPICTRYFAINKTEEIMTIPFAYIRIRELKLYAFN